MSVPQSTVAPATPFLMKPVVVLTVAMAGLGLLAPGRRGIGFGVGTEPLPALFANRGVEVVASDLGLDDLLRDAGPAADAGPRGVALETGPRHPDSLARSRAAWGVAIALVLGGAALLVRSRRGKR